MQCIILTISNLASPPELHPSLRLFHFKCFDTFSLMLERVCACGATRIQNFMGSILISASAPMSFMTRSFSFDLFHSRGILHFFTSFTRNSQCHLECRCTSHKFSRTSALSFDSLPLSEWELYCTFEWRRKNPKMHQRGQLDVSYYVRTSSAGMQENRGWVG